MTEIQVGERIFSCDGRVVEIFGFGGDSRSQRYHVALIEKIEIAPPPAPFGKIKDKLTLQIIPTDPSSTLMVLFPEEKRAEVEQFIAEVMQAKAAHRLGQNP